MRFTPVLTILSIILTACSQVSSLKHSKEGKDSSLQTVTSSADSVDNLRALPPKQNKSGHITHHKLYSTILQEDRFAEVYTPDSITLGNQYEVIYVLDGAAHFGNLLNILQQLASDTGDSSYLQKIVVGIGNIWTRDRDYTPTHIDSSAFVDSNAARVSGGGDKFIAFLEKELIPYINSQFPTSGKHMIIGHSLGGLMVVDLLLHHTSLFNRYAAIDPGMWWDQHKLLEQSRSILPNKKFDECSLYIAIANTREREVNDVSKLRKDTTRAAALTRPSLLLSDYILANRKNKLDYQWKYYPDLNHMSVYSSATYDALKFLLRPDVKD